MAFFAVLREGLETSVFLLAAFQNTSDPVSAGFGAVLGVLVAVVIGVGIYRGGVRLAGYVVYALPMLMFLLLADRFRPQRRRVVGSASTATLLVLVAGILLTACGGSDDEGTKPSRAEASAVATTYADSVIAAYDASVASTEKMGTSIDAFLAKPNAGRLAAARKAWLSARDDYIVTEPFRFYGGPIDDPKDGPEGKINSWPMDEAYVDYVVGNPNAGIVNDRKDYPKLTADVIVEANEQGGETNISSGWHAIEFLLWGQDRSKTGPGDRPASDYTSAPNADRRADYLRLTTKQLLSDLTSVRDQWAKQGGTFRRSFLADPDRAVRRIIRGIGALAVTELAGERMAVALESGDQEDEHSCFSDNTNADVVNDIKGIRMVYEADFPGVTGPSLQSLVEARDTELAGDLRSEIDKALATARAFPATFETMIAAPKGSADHKAFGDVIDDLEDFGESLGDAADELDVKVGFAV